MLLEYEREILRESDGKSCLLIMAGGLNIQGIILLNIGFYLNSNSLALLVNFCDEEKDMVLGLDSSFLHDLRSLQRTQRRDRYLDGGVCVGSSRIFVSDMIDGTVDIERISCVLVSNVELVTETSSVAFIIHMFRTRNRDGLVKGFSESPVALSLGFSPLDKRMKSLKLDKVLFFPRFHRKVDESLNGDASLTEIRLKLPTRIAQIQVALMEIVDNLLRSVLRGGERQEINSELIVFGDIRKIFRTAGVSDRRAMEDIHNIRTLMFLLFSSDSATFYRCTRRLLREQVELGKESTWINLPVSHVLADKARELLDEHLGKVRDVFGDKGALDLDSDDERDTGSTAEAVRLFYGLSPKIKKLVEVLEGLRGTRSVVLVSSSITKEIQTRILLDLGLVSMCEGSKEILMLTHHEFRYHSDDYDVVVFVDPCQDSVRKIERYGVLHVVKVYFLIYSGSLEEQRYLNEIRREKASFEKLIEERSRLPLRLDCEEEAMDLEEYEDVNRDYTIVVDTRELRSDLPFYLFRAKNRLVVSTLPTGDYVLGPTTCIERKTIQDFISSLNTGRLYLQATMLCHKYKKPFLLLEFDGRPCISDHYNHNQDTFKNSVIARFALFLYHFSQVRVMWSDSRLFSTKLIRDLQKHEDVSPGEEHRAMDPTLQEILLSIPGITPFNLRRVVDGFVNLRDLMTSDMERLRDALGPEKCEVVYEFFRKGF